MLDTRMSENEQAEERSEGQTRLAIIGGAAMVLVVGGVILAFQFDSVREAVDFEALAQWARPHRGDPVVGALSVLLFTLVSALGVPVTLLIMGTTFAFGAWIGAGYSLVGVVLGSIIGYWGGRTLGKATVRRLLGSKLERVEGAVGKTGLAPLVLARFVPVAPFAVVNLTAGAIGVRHRPFVISTTIASIPGVAGVALIGDQLRRTFESPTPTSVGLLVGVVAAVIALTAGLQWAGKKWKERREQR